MVFEQVDPLSRGRNERNPGNRRIQQVEESNSRRSPSRTRKRTRDRLCHRTYPSGLLRMRDPEASLQDAPEKIRFRSYHVNYQDGDKRESWNSKRIFGHAAYPTYTIHVKSHVGPLEIYRSVYPPMEELEKQIKESFELAEFYKAEAETASRSRTDDL